MIESSTIKGHMLGSIKSAMQSNSRPLVQGFMTTRTNNACLSRTNLVHQLVHDAIFGACT